MVSHCPCTDVLEGPPPSRVFTSTMLGEIAFCYPKQCADMYNDRFIPGTSASAVNYHAYLLDGITRWNSARADAAINTSCGSNTLRTFNSELKWKVYALYELLVSFNYPYFSADQWSESKCSGGSGVPQSPATIGLHRGAVWSRIPFPAVRGVVLSYRE